MRPVKPKRLLLVDDEAGIRGTLPAILQMRGFTVEVAASVAEAVQKLHEQMFDVLLCDLNLSGSKDGYDVIRAMKALNPHCVNIIYTGYPEIESAVEAVHLGVDDYIIKPAAVNALVAAVEANLVKRQPKARILCVSNDEPLLRTRQMLLELAGYEVVSSIGYAASLEHCEEGDFDVFVLGHSIPYSEKERLVETFRRVCSAPIISLRRGIGEQPLKGADIHIDPDPEQLLAAISAITRAKHSHHAGQS